MKKTVNKYTNSAVRNTFLFAIFFAILFLLSSNLFFKDYKSNLLDRASKNFELNINYLNTYFDKNILLFKNDLISSLNTDINKNTFKEINLEYNRYIFDKNSLIDNTPNFSDKSWRLAEVTVDVRYGYINKIKNTSLYEFIPSGTFNTDLPISIRYQVYNKGEIRNFLTKLDFSNKRLTNTLDGDKFFKMVNSLMDIDLSNKAHIIEIDNQNIAMVTYKLNDYSIKEELQNFIVKIVVYTLIMILPLLFLVTFYHKYIFKKYVTNPIDYLNNYLDNIIGNKYQNIQKDQFEGTPEIIELTKKVTKISSKVASLTNELNINKESLELKVSTDTLTGLPNRSIFDFDVKNMFVSLTKGYVFIIKIDDLAKLSKKFDSGYVNNFIENYVSILKNVLFKYSKSDIKIYRFYGSQFAIVAKKVQIEQVTKMCEEMVENITAKLLPSYDINGDIIQIGCTSFDLYGTIDGVIESANDAYMTAKEKGHNSYHIIAEEDIAKNYELLDNNVREIIEKDNFQLDFVLDTFLFDEPEKVIMKEVAPILYDHHNERLFIGSFVSVAQKLNIIDKFDKLVVQKTVNYLKENDCDYELSVNLSFVSITNNDFMNWLESYIEEIGVIRNKLVFSITAYSAYMNKNDFIRFVNKVHELGSKVILKRYKTEEYPLEELQKLNLEYIRMHKDYTTGFTNDVVKKHKVKNTLIFGELNNIKVIADTVKLDLDYNLLDRLGTYATSK